MNTRKTLTAQAALYDRGGGLIYDDVLNVPWLQDANYAKVSGHDADGHVTGQNRVDWAPCRHWPLLGSDANNDFC